MHEYSIVQSLLNSCEEHAAENNASSVSKVVVKIGVMSGVEPDLLQTAFDTFKEKSVCENAEFVINIQKVIIVCNECKTEKVLEELEYKCDNCGSINVEVIDGEEMYLMQLELN
ncbi:hydrogenase/urease nickel incorporation protein HypA [Sulfurimonas sp. C5]|uniref:hydrogenase/urease nickel incorporation protein HypA n=1 Tax=Sulfurimonas sp. C5 TaxID=3036947 RepID=UPI00245892F2|nr:hydrogenase/urease nickel incorporation protein HypA [Sulfurimonas sp. C5]MDH4943624.1 hydrogenase/urease nickel incorporation protein HypA [Sulfurimonas sp. C5]